MSEAAHHLVSEAEFLTLPESTERLELVDGEVIMSPSPSYWHQEILTRIVARLREWAADTESSVTVAQGPLDVRFGEGRILQPDAMVFKTRLEREQQGPVDRVPELCIEVLSSNRAYDRITKRFIYAEAGVQEYWLVDPATHIERRSGDGLARVERIDERLTTPLLPGFVLDAKALLES
ncbi:MAG: Uma2 family endonuclease [Proteobacteria bacterium]|nr:Uma2 family endonuclease [Pseudomonadota bacterium]